ncbi:MAG: 23S rRNA (adenine(2503)-C(2))-methyltransferase @ tRNA (adenine(37)-C(2))-methyltransferase, partial [uncultured Frankineae bacterium]
AHAPAPRLRRAQALPAAPSPRRPRRRRPAGRGGRARREGLPRRAAVPALLRRSPARADDRPRRTGPRQARRLAAAAAAGPGAHDRLRRGRHREDAVARPRRHARGVGAHALPRPHDRLREQPGRLRHGLPVLRHRAGRADPQPVDRRDRRAGGGCLAHGVGAGRTRQQRRLHGHGGAARQLQARRRRGAPDHRARAARHRDRPAQRRGLDRRAGARDAQAHRRGPAGHAGAVAARPRRRAARHAGPGQHPLAGARGARGGVRLHPPDGPAPVDRVRADPRRERPAVAGRPAGQAAGRQAGARQPHPAQPDAGLAVGRLAEGGRAGVRAAAARRRRQRHRPRHPRPRDRRRLRPAVRRGGV